MTTLKGFKKMAGVSKKTGNKYDGYIFYCEEDRTPEEVKGVICFEKFVNTADLNGEPYLGAEVRFGYDYTGRLIGVEVL